jgi:hypothetical protein
MPVKLLDLSLDSRFRSFFFGGSIDHENLIVFFIKVNLFVALNSFIGVRSWINNWSGDWSIFNNIPVVPAS